MVVFEMIFCRFSSLGELKTLFFQLEPLWTVQKKIAPDRYRTCDIQINSLTLYRLSYRSTGSDLGDSNTRSVELQSIAFK